MTTTTQDAETARFETGLTTFNAHTKHDIVFLKAMIANFFLLRRMAELPDQETRKAFFEKRAGNERAATWLRHTMVLVAANTDVTRYLVLQGVDPMPTFCWCALRALDYQLILVDFLQQQPRDRLHEAQTYVSKTVSGDALRDALDYMSASEITPHESYGLLLCLWLSKENISRHGRRGADDFLPWAAQPKWSNAAWQAVRDDPDKWLSFFERNCLGHIMLRAVWSGEKDPMMDAALTVLTLYCKLRAPCTTRSAVVESLVRKFGGRARAPNSVKRLVAEIVS